jgi:uncharacterized protein (TIGR02266 family)
MSEKRKFVRIPLERQVKINFKGKYNFMHKIANISLGGMFLKTPIIIPIGEIFSFEFTIDGFTPKITGKGQVVRITEDLKGNQNGMGIQFLTLDPVGRETITNLISEYQAKEKSKEPE